MKHTVLLLKTIKMLLLLLIGSVHHFTFVLLFYLFISMLFIFLSFNLRRNVMLMLVRIIKYAEDKYGTVSLALDSFPIYINIYIFPI